MLAATRAAGGHPRTPVSVKIHKQTVGASVKIHVQTAGASVKIHMKTVGASVKIHRRTVGASVKILYSLYYCTFVRLYVCTLGSTWGARA